MKTLVHRGEAMFVRPEDLVALGGHGGRLFEELLYDLVVAEASRHGIPLSAVHWDHRINIGDGGRDIIVDASHTDPVRFIPQRPSIWSAKSGKDGTQPGTLRQELIDPRHPAVREHLQAANPFVWCTLHPMSEDELSALRDKARELSEDPANYIFNPHLVEFRGLTTLCNALNDNPGLIAKHLPPVARVFDGVLNLAEWERLDRAGFATQFVDFGNRSQVVAQIRSHFRSRTGPNVLHLAGLSGIGKTRTVLEACRDQRDLSGVLYIPRHADFREPLLRHLTRNSNLFALVVVDEVLLEDLRPLISQVEHVGHRLRFVTIGPARRNERTRASANILVLPEPRTREGVLEIVRAAGAGISEPVLDSIARFAAHDLRLALMLVEATRQDGSLRDLPIKDGEDVWKRVTNLFAARLGNLDAFRTNYPFLTVGLDIGVQGEIRHELEVIADRFAVDVQRLDEAIAMAAPCGLGVQSTDFFEPAPRALAGHVFRQRIWGALQPRLADFLRGLPDRLLRRFLERCQECAGPEREEMEDALASFFRNELGSPDVTRLVDRGRSRLFKAWAELDPIRGLDWLQRAAEDASDAQLSTFDGEPDGSGGWRGRRQIVWLCESLASFEEYFWRCEAVLFRLAQVETEPSIGNNSTAMWKSLFQPVFAFTEVSFPDRANHLLRRLAASTERTLGLVFSAVNEALAGYFGGRMVPPAIVGGRVVPEPWSPSTNVELYRLQREVGQRALEQVSRLPATLLLSGRQIVVANLQAFVRLGLVQELRALTDPGDTELKRALHTQLRQVIDFQERTQQRGGGSESEVRSELRHWEETLRPQDLPGRVKALTFRDYWEVLRERRSPEVPSVPSPYAQLAEEVLREPDVLRQLEDWFGSDAPKSGFNFAIALGEADQNDSVAATIAAWLEAGRCRALVSGYLRGVSTRRGALPTEWSERLERSAAHHQEFAAIVTADADFSQTGLQRIVRMVDSGTIHLRFLRAFISPNWEPHIGLPERVELLERLLRLQDRNPSEALGTALSLGTSWTDFGRQPLPPELAELVIPLLRASLDARTDPGDWSSLFETLLQTCPEVAADLAADALTSAGPLRVFLEDLILPPLQELARRHPRLVMDAIGLRILDPAKRPYFGLCSFPNLFEAIGLQEVQRWVGEHGADPIRYIARHLASPHIENDSPFIPPLTDWVLTEFGQDDRIFREFCAGRHAFEERTGHAREHRAELEQALAPFRSHEKSWVRGWVEYELRESERDAELDDMLDDRHERM